MCDLINLKHRYSPWDKDIEFNDIYDKVLNNTLVDKIRCFELWQLVKQSAKLESGCLIEIGIWRGGSGAIISKCAELNNIKDRIYLCDNFLGVIKSSEKDCAYKNGEHSDTDINIVSTLFDELNIKNIEILKGVFPDETGSLIKDQVIRFCHIDVDTYQSAKDIFCYIWDKMVVGGIIVYDDYGFNECNGITEHVNEFINDEDKLFIYNINGHAIIVKTK